MYSTHNKGKSVVAERFIRTLKTKIHKYISKNIYIYTYIYIYIYKLDNIINKHNNTYHRTIKMKPVDGIIRILILKKEVDDKYPKFKVGDQARISK